ncbi:MAG: hypothetical protein L0177_05785 [Chloroflexi bacterium]|nr:hypothetical protein [Chloroflexota bacterium]
MRHLERVERSFPPEAKPFEGMCLVPSPEVHYEALMALVEAGAIEEGDVEEFVSYHRRTLEALFCEEHRARLKPYRDGFFYHDLYERV